MERDASQHPGPSSARVNVQGRDLSDDELSALTPEQRTRLTSGEPLPVDPRSPLADPDVRLIDEAAGRSPVAVALDKVEGMGDGDGDGLMDHSGSSSEDRRETDTGATTDEWADERDTAAATMAGVPERDADSDTPIADSIERPADLDDAPAPRFRRVQ